MIGSMNKSYLKYFCIVFFVFLISCDGKVPLVASGVSGPEGLPAEEASFAKFNDLPMPSNSKMNLEKSLVFGADSEWFGRLNLIVKMSGAEVFDFYRYEMPNFGWEEVTSVRSEISILTYTRENRVVTIQLASNNIGGTRASVTVSPKGSK